MARIACEPATMGTKDEDNFRQLMSLQSIFQVQCFQLGTIQDANIVDICTPEHSAAQHTNGSNL